MDLQRINIFLAVCRTGSFAAAARAQNVAPSSISRAVAALEQDLGVRLFDRTTRRLSLTAAGEQYRAQVGPAIDALSEAHAGIAATGAIPSGPLRISASAAFAELVLAPALPDFTAAYPEVTVDLVTTDRTVDLVAERIDLAVRHGQLADSSLIAAKWRGVRYFLCAAPEIARCAAPTSPEEIAGLPAVAFPLPAFSRAWTFTRGGETRRVAISPRLTISNAAALKAALIAGAGIGLLGDWTIGPSFDTGELVPLLPEWEARGENRETGLFIVTPSRRLPSAALRVFRDFLSGLDVTRPA